MDHHRRPAPEYGAASNAWQQLAQECAQGAIYDSNERQPHSKCLPGTRVGLLHSLRSMSEGDPDERKIVWIAGESGSGKSTIAHTLADTLREEGRLAGTFFFSRKHSKRSTFDHVFLTLAYQLGLQHPHAREIIVKAISDDPALLSSEKSRRDQLEKLVIAPLLFLARYWKGTRMSMIIDALDEGIANGIHHIRPFIILLAGLVRNLSLPIHNIFISGRSWSQIDSVMCDDEFADIVQVIRLENYDSHHDVDRFLRRAFDQMYKSHDLSSVLSAEPWPPESDFLMLSERARGRFIFAATIARFIDQDQPQDRLPLVCSMLRGDVEQVWGNIDHLYSAIIDEIDLPARELGMKYLSLIVNLAEPLSLSDLRLFFGVDIYSSLLPFSAFISLPSLASSDLVQIHHTSFRDFLQKRDQTDGYRTHQVLSSACFRTMARLLKRDICNLQDPSLLHEEISDFAQKRDAIPLSLRYALCYWLHHMQNSQINSEVQEHLLDFLEKRVLFAIEAYAVFGELGTGVVFLRSARKFLMNWPARSFPRKNVAIALLYDSWRLALEFFDAIDSSALHVYESALPCCPETSQIRTTYSWLLHGNTGIVVEEGLRDNWNCITRVINMTDEFPSPVWPLLSLSPDGSQVVIAFSTAVSVFDTATGLLIASLPLTTTFSEWFSVKHGGSAIVIADYEPQFFIWHIYTETLTPILFSGPRSKIVERGSCSITFSHDGAKVAIGRVMSTTERTREPFIQIFDVNTCAPLLYFFLPVTGPGFEFLSSEFCRNDTCLMVNATGCIFFFDALDGRLMGHMDYKEQELHHHFVSPDDSCIIRVTPGEQDSKLAVAQLSFLPIDTSLHRERSSSPYTSPWLIPRTTRVPLNVDEWLRLCTLGLHGSAEGETSHIICNIGEMTTVDMESVLSVAVQSLYVPQVEAPVGIRFGEKIKAIHRSGSTRWMSNEDECFGICFLGGKMFGIVDLVQLSDQPSFSLTTSQVRFGHPEPDPGEDWTLVCSSDQDEFTAYYSSEEVAYLIIRSTSTNEVSQCKIDTDFPVMPLSAALTPRGTFFLIAEHSSGQQGRGRVQIWDPSTGKHIMTRSVLVPFRNADYEIYWLGFSEDDTIGVLLQCFYENQPPRFCIFSFRGGKLEKVGDFLFPQPDGYFHLASVNLNAVDFWWLPEDGSGIVAKHFRWQRATSTLVEVAFFPRFPFTFKVARCNIENSTSFRRIYCLLGDHVIVGSISAYAMNLVEQEDAGTQVYDVDEDNDPQAFYDTHSWSDLCIDAGGWLRKRTRRICWMHPRYRPKSPFRKYAGLKLEISGNKVTFLHPEIPSDRITIRLLNTQIEYFE